MTLVTRLHGMPLPLPCAASQIATPWLYAAALEARADLLRLPSIADMRHPLAHVANGVSRRWCRNGRHGLIDDATDRAWMASAITEILSIDPVTLAYLRSHGRPVPCCPSGSRRHAGGRA